HSQALAQPARLPGAVVRAGGRERDDFRRRAVHPLSPIVLTDAERAHHRGGRAIHSVPRGRRAAHRRVLPLAPEGNVDAARAVGGLFQPGDFRVAHAAAARDQRGGGLLSDRRLPRFGPDARPAARVFAMGDGIDLWRRATTCRRRFVLEPGASTWPHVNAIPPAKTPPRLAMHTKGSTASFTSARGWRFCPRWRPTNPG